MDLVERLRLRCVAETQCGVSNGEPLPPPPPGSVLCPAPCPCASAGIPCDGRVCDCSAPIGDTAGHKCTNPLGCNRYDAESVRAHRRTWLLACNPPLSSSSSPGRGPKTPSGSPGANRGVAATATATATPLSAEGVSGPATPPSPLVLPASQLVVSPPPTLELPQGMSSPEDTGVANGEDPRGRLFSPLSPPLSARVPRYTRAPESPLSSLDPDSDPLALPATALSVHQHPLDSEALPPPELEPPPPGGGGLEVDEDLAAALALAWELDQALVMEEKKGEEGEDPDGEGQWVTPGSGKASGSHHGPKHPAAASSGKGSPKKGGAAQGAASASVAGRRKGGKGAPLPVPAPSAPVAPARAPVIGAGHAGAPVPVLVAGSASGGSSVPLAEGPRIGGGGDGDVRGGGGDRGVTHRREHKGGRRQGHSGTVTAVPPAVLTSATASGTGGSASGFHARALHTAPSSLNSAANVNGSGAPSSGGGGVHTVAPTAAAPSLASCGASARGGRGPRAGAGGRHAGGGSGASGRGTASQGRGPAPAVALHARAANQPVGPAVDA